jgi:hypothetical protein
MSAGDETTVKPAMRRRGEEPDLEPPAHDPLAKWRKHAHLPELEDWAKVLKDVHRLCEGAQSEALRYAVEAGRALLEAKKQLKAHPSLMPIRVFMQLYVPDIPQRTASEYEICYRQVLLDSGKGRYSTIRGCVREWRKAHRRERLKVRSKELLDRAEPPELPEEDRIRHTKGWWLDSPERHEVIAHVEAHGYTEPPRSKNWPPEVRHYLRSICDFLPWLEKQEQIDVELANWLEVFSGRPVRILRHQTLNQRRGRRPRS